MATEMANVKVKYCQLRMWHVEYLKKYWAFFELILTQHNNNVNELIASWMSDKVTPSATLIADQERIIHHVSATKEIVSSLSVDKSTLSDDIDCIIKNLNELKSVFAEHFATKEKGMLTTIHKCFSQNEFKSIQDKILASFKALGYGWVLYGFDTNKKRSKWLKNVIQMSALKRWTLLSNDYRKFDKHTRKLLTEIMTSH
jgi:hypothetical protein